MAATKICPACKGKGKEIIVTSGLLPVPVVQICPCCKGKGYIEIAK